MHNAANVLPECKEKENEETASDAKVHKRARRKLFIEENSEPLHIEFLGQCQGILLV